MAAYGEQEEIKEHCKGLDAVLTWLFPSHLVLPGDYATLCPQQAFTHAALQKAFPGSTAEPVRAWKLLRPTGQLVQGVSRIYLLVCSLADQNSLRQLVSSRAALLSTVDSASSLGSNGVSETSGSSLAVAAAMFVCRA